VDRRTLTGAALFAAGLLALGGRAAAADEANAEHPHAAHFLACAKECSDCQRECDSCANHCAHMVADGKKDHLKTLGTCADCATLCTTAARITARQGPFAVAACEACTKACAGCGAGCEKFPDDAHMKRRAEECRRCEKACRDMIEHAGRDGEK
jgi:hypothetical protein